MAGILFLCTGNAARSVMAEAFLRDVAPGWEVASAGTHSIDGQPVGWRTRRAMAEWGGGTDDHRSRQARPDDLRRADLIATFEPFQLAWVRREEPGAAPRAGALRHLAAALPGPAGGEPLAERVARLDLGAEPADAWPEVVDPGGGDLPAFVAAAAEVRALVAALAARLGPAPHPPTAT